MFALELWWSTNTPTDTFMAIDSFFSRSRGFFKFTYKYILSVQIYFFHKKERILGHCVSFFTYLVVSKKLGYPLHLIIFVDIDVHVYLSNIYECWLVRGGVMRPRRCFKTSNAHVIVKKRSITPALEHLKTLFSYGWWIVS